jgi:hypothetical protein
VVDPGRMAHLAVRTTAKGHERVPCVQTAKLGHLLSQLDATA